MPKSHLILLFFLTTVAGCSYLDSTTGVAITGHVTYQGRTISYGLITFNPPVTAPGRSASARILNGRYSIPREQGPFPGEHFVQIVSLETVMNRVDPSRPPLAGSLQIPKNYNFDTSLKVSIPKRNWMFYSFDLK